MHTLRLLPRHPLVVASVIIGVAVALVATVWAFGNRQAPPAAAPSVRQIKSTASAQAPVQASGLRAHVLFVGDIFWDRGVNRRAQASTLKEAYPFSRLQEFSRDTYDGWIGNLECPSVPGVQQPYDLEVEQLLFNCPTTYLPEMAKWFTAVSLANNHSANQHGQAGLDATRTALAAQRPYRSGCAVTAGTLRLSWCGSHSAGRITGGHETICSLDAGHCVSPYGYRV